MRKILLVFESRASYGYSKNLFDLFKKDKKININTLVTGTHLSRELGYSLKNITKDKIKINYKITFYNKNFSIGIGRLIIAFSKVLKKLKPDIVVIFGDRVELMGIAISCSYNNYAIAHVQAGDRSGHIDDMTRMAISKLAHIHFPATKKAYNRLLRLGEQKKRIHLVGAPQLDDINHKKLIKKKFLKIGNQVININEKYLVILQHPVFKHQKTYKKIFKKTLAACSKFKLKKYIIYPNYDPGYKHIINSIKKLNDSSFFFFKNIERQTFLSLVANSEALIGNSSSAILESPSLKIGVVNIGDRQNYREKNKNILNASYSERDIYLKICKAINIKTKIKNIKNIHGDGKSSKRIYKFLKKVKISKELLNKDTTY